VTVAKPVVREVIDSDEFIGRFQAVDEVSVRSRIGGYLQEVHFQDGAMVKQGDLLFVIDQRPYINALNEATASLEVSKSTLTNADAQFARTQSLASTGSLSASNLDDRRRDLISAQANVRGAQAAVDRATLDMEYTKITAPLSGRIDRRLISVGNLVQADQTALTSIVSLDPIDFYFDVDERRLLSYADQARKNGSNLQEGGGEPFTDGLALRVGIGWGKPSYEDVHASPDSILGPKSTPRFVAVKWPRAGLSPVRTSWSGSKTAIISAVASGYFLLG
jgi:RND family efflux transporter MFP subunit